MSKPGEIITPSEEEIAACGGTPPEQSESADQPETLPAETAEKAAPSEAAPAEAAPSEAEEWRERCLRARAELSNYQKRVEKERAESIRYAHTELARALLPVLDDLDRILDNVGEVKASFESVVEGIRLTRENFLKVLAQFHIRPIEALGRPFDPSVHEALMEQSSDQPERTVLQEIAKGYTIHDRVLRPSKVIVSRKPDAASSGEAPAAD